MSDEIISAEAEQKQLDDIFTQRKAKAEELRAAGIAPYGVFVDNIIPTTEARAKYVPDVENTEIVTVAGRIMTFRVMGKATFLHIKDQHGSLQLYAQRDMLGEEEYKRFKRLDPGDLIAATGHMFVTKTGEITLKMQSYTMLSKSLRPLPEKFHGLTDMEQRYRQRYLDLIMNDESRSLFFKRIQIIREIRNFLEARGFLEVETPMLQYIPGGAAATPFKTHYNALDCDMYMRIAPELYLKRLLVGGFEILDIPGRLPLCHGEVVHHVVAAVLRRGAGDFALIVPDIPERVQQDGIHLRRRGTAFHDDVASGHAAHRAPVDELVLPVRVVAKVRGDQVLDGVHRRRVDGGFPVREPHADIESGGELFAENVHPALVDAGDDLRMVNGKAWDEIHVCFLSSCSCRNSPGPGRPGCPCRRSRRSGRTGSR